MKKKYLNLSKQRFPWIKGLEVTRDLEGVSTDEALIVFADRTSVLDPELFKATHFSALIYITFLPVNPIKLRAFGPSIVEQARKGKVQSVVHEIEKIYNRFKAHLKGEENVDKNH